MTTTPAPPQPGLAAGGEAPEDVAATAGRKDDHLRIAARPSALHASGTGLERHRLVHRALPGRDLAAVDLTTGLLGRTLRAPLLISAMTGGSDGAALVNDRLAEAATEHGLGLALGSGRALLADPSLLPTYLGARRPPLLLANLGAAQLLEPGAVEQARRLVGLLGADALAIHLNPLQEAVQPEGQTRFGGLLAAIETLCAGLGDVPVVVKEVGFGIAAADVTRLAGAGVAAVDVAGAGGTNWALVEGARDPERAAVAAAFADWGLPTADAVAGAAAVDRRGAALIASGGITDGVQAATCLALGADAVGLARHLLLAAQEDRATQALGVVVEQLRIATWLTGAATSAELGPAQLVGEGHGGAAHGPGGGAPAPHGGAA